MSNVNINVTSDPDPVVPQPQAMPPQAGQPGEALRVDASTMLPPHGQVRVWVAVVERGSAREIVRKTAVFINPNDNVDEFLREVFTKLAPLLDYCNHPAALTMTVNGRAMDASEPIRALLVNPLLVIEAPQPTFTQRGRESVTNRLDNVGAQLKVITDRMDYLTSLQKDTQSKLTAMDKVGVDSHFSVHARLSVMGAPTQTTAIVAPRDPNGQEIKYPVTWYLIMCSLLASCGGILFGYDVGIAGGVVSMQSFKQRFFQNILDKEAAVEASKAAGASGDKYCVYADDYLQLIVSSLFITAMVTAQLASYLNPRIGRKYVMLISGIAYIIGTFVLAGASSVFMLVLGRIFWGLSVGMASATVPLYISEMAPPNLRGTFNILFQVAITLGILAANLINFGFEKHPNGWRYSWGLGGIPAAMMTVGALILPNTPSSLLELGKLSEAHDVLRRVRGFSPFVDQEYNQLVDECKHAASINSSSGASWQNLLTRPLRCGLLVVTVIPFLQQLTGINIVMFYAPQLYIAAGVKDPLVQTLLGSAVMVCGTFVSLYLVDRVGRRALFIEGGLQMIIALILMAIMWGADIAVSYGGLAVFFTCVFTSGFSWSWGPVAWLVPTEVLPVELRSTGMAICTTVNYLFTAVIGQAALSMLCSMRFGVFLFFAFWIVIAVVYTWLFLPETKGVPLEKIMDSIHEHWFWGSYTPAQAHHHQMTSQGNLNKDNAPVGFAPLH